MLSLSFDPAETEMISTQLPTSVAFFPLKTFNGSSRGNTSREGVGVICDGSLGSSESVWSSLFVLPEIGVEVVNCGRTEIEEGVSVSDLGVVVDEATHRRKLITSSETRTT